MSTISVIIPCYNHAHYLPEAVGSALGQSRSPAEVIVIDDGSTDETPLVARAFGERINYIRQENRGLAGARNTGVRAARGEVVALLDSDDRWLPEFLETMAGMLEQHAEAAVAYCGWRYIDADGRELPQLDGTTPVAPAAVYRRLLRGDFMVPSGIVLRRQTAIDAGLFDESLRVQEDWDLWLRLARRHTFVGTGDCLVQYRVSPGSLSTNLPFMEQTLFAIVEKHFGRDEGDPGGWPLEKRWAYGGAHRSSAISSWCRAHDAAGAARHLGAALRADPSLAGDLDLFYELALGAQPQGLRGLFEHLDFEARAADLQGLLGVVFDPAQRDGPPGAVRRLALAHASLALGLVAYGCRRAARARTYLTRALAASPSLAWRSRALPMLLRSLLGSTTLEYARRWRRSAR